MGHPDIICHAVEQILVKFLKATVSRDTEYYTTQRTGNFGAHFAHI